MNGCEMSENDELVRNFLLTLKFKLILQKPIEKLILLFIKIIFAIIIIRDIPVQYQNFDAG